MIDVLTDPPPSKYTEAAPKIQVEEFKKAVASRRSVRVFDGTPIPEAVVNECIDLALMAPNSSNLQPWEFYWVKTDWKKKQLIQACMNQSAAKTAAELIVCVARRDTWWRNRDLMIASLEQLTTRVPHSAMLYYKKLVPVMYSQGWFSWMGWLKRAVFFAIGFFKPIMREPVSNSGMETWAVKTTALACENLMLAFRAHGFDTCPMEGMDSTRVKKIIGVPRSAQIVMVVGAGKRAPNGIFGPQLRFDRKLFVHEI